MGPIANFPWTTDSESRFVPPAAYVKSQLPSNGTADFLPSGPMTSLDFIVGMLKLVDDVQEIYSAGTEDNQEIFIVCSSLANATVLKISEIESDILDFLTALNSGGGTTPKIDFHIVPVQDGVSSRCKKIFDRATQKASPYANELRAPAPSAQK